MKTRWLVMGRTPWLIGSMTLAALVLVLAPLPSAQAQVVTSISVAPSTPKINEKVKITVSGHLPPGKTCRLVYLRGDGTPQSNLGVATSFPFSWKESYHWHSYSKAGTYTIKVWGDPKDLNHPCSGKAEATVKVGLTPPPPDGPKKVTPPELYPKPVPGPPPIEKKLDKQ